jgi:hypothetical protein
MEATGTFGHGGHKMGASVPTISGLLYQSGIVVLYDRMNA